MARLLYVRNSVAFVLGAVRRHMRLSRKATGGETFYAAIAPSRDALTFKKEQYEKAAEITEDAADDIVLAKGELGNCIRDVFDACKKFERGSGNGSILNRVFPDGTFSEMVNSTHQKIHKEAKDMVTRILSLGSRHEINPFALLLNEKIAALDAVIATHTASEQIEQTASAEMEIAKANLVKLYEDNYLDARRKLGRVAAEKIFPALTNKPKPKNDGDTPPKPNGGDK